jgi:hypothetical protein
LTYKNEGIVQARLWWCYATNFVKRITSTYTHGSLPDPGRVLGTSGIQICNCYDDFPSVLQAPLCERTTYLRRKTATTGVPFMSSPNEDFSAGLAGLCKDTDSSSAGIVDNGAADMSDKSGGMQVPIDVTVKPELQVPELPVISDAWTNGANCQVNNSINSSKLRGCILTN